MTSRRIRRIAVLLALLAGVSARASAQDLEYRVATRGKFSGAMGAASAMMGPEQATSGRAYLKGTRVRLELGPNPFILDATRQEMTVLDATRKTYATIAVKDLPAASDSILKSAGLGAAVTVTAGRGFERVNGLDARRTTVLVRVPARNPRAPRATDLLLVSEVWTTNQNGIGAAYDRVAGILGRSGLGGSLLMMLAAQNPRMAAAMQISNNRLASMRGLPVRRANVYGTVPANARFTPGMPMDTLMSMRTDLTDVKNASLPASLFQVPAGYVPQPRK